MTPYSIELSKRALADLERLDRTAGRRIVKRLDWLAENFESIVPLPLTGDLAGSYKLRVGDYRVIYRVVHDEGLLHIEVIGHRRDVYGS